MLLRFCQLKKDYMYDNIMLMLLQIFTTFYIYYKVLYGTGKGNCSRKDKP